jgi:hypothetical protein
MEQQKLGEISKAFHDLLFVDQQKVEFVNRAYDAVAAEYRKRDADLNVIGRPNEVRREYTESAAEFGMTGEEFDRIFYLVETTNRYHAAAYC